MGKRIGRPPTAIADRLWEKVVKGGPDECWSWTGSHVKGYGRIQAGVGLTLRAHRVAYELTVGPIPEGLTIDHLCNHAWCMNPAHMEPVTQAENSRRKGQRITHCRRGHPFDEANTYWWGPERKWRSCRECERFKQSHIPTRVHRYVPRPSRRKVA